MDTRSLVNELHNPRWREILLAQVHANTDAYHRHVAMYKPLGEAERVGQLKSELAPDAHDCELLVRIGLIGEFPSREPWPDAGEEVLTWFWTLRHPSFARVIEQHFDTASDGSRASALVLLASQETPEATDLMVGLIKQHGLPRRIPPRFFWEINKRHTAVANRLFPELLFRAGQELAGVMNYLNASLEAGHLSAEMLRPAAEWIESEAVHLLDRIEPLQRAEGTKWRTDEEYFGLRSELGVLLDLLGIVPGTSSDPLDRAAHLNDPLLVFFAVVSMLKRGIEPSATALLACAKSHETRAALHKQLKFLSKLDLFPREFLSFEAFAAAAMTEWLLYPAELGYEPSSLELVAEGEGIKDGESVVMCLWKFTTEEGEVFAAASGPYPASRPSEPLWGQDTFSNFTAWEKITPEEHLEGILETLDNWKVAWCKEQM
jgi:hypothetical protein